mgnify:CR=1 FL=1
MDLIVTKYNLATRQANSFRMIARHFLLEESAPLLFHFGGVAGTGKSHVVLAISKLFEICQKPELFMKVSYMGCAASLIGGSSICQELCLMSKSITLSVNDDNLGKIMDTFCNIRYFLIDTPYIVIIYRKLIQDYNRQKTQCQCLEAYQLLHVAIIINLNRLKA